MKKKVHDISTTWGQALLNADSAFPRPERITLPLTVPERTALVNAAAREGVSPEVFLLAIWLDWYQQNWKKQVRECDA